MVFGMSEYSTKSVEVETACSRSRKIQIEASKPFCTLGNRMKMIYTGKEWELLLRRVKQNNLIFYWRSISSGIILTRFKAKVRNVIVVQCYISRGRCTDSKIGICAELQVAVQNRRRKDILIVMREFKGEVR